jgi:hypothetical protein
MGLIKDLEKAGHELYRAGTITDIDAWYRALYAAEKKFKKKCLEIKAKSRAATLRIWDEEQAYEQACEDIIKEI